VVINRRRRRQHLPIANMKMPPAPNRSSQRQRRCAQPRNQRGVGLIEVLVAVLVLSLGLLGMAGMQARALKTNQSSYARSQAVMLSYYILDAMRADSAAAKGGNYTTGDTDLCEAAAIGGTSLADNNRKDWLAEMKTALGNETTTCGAITCDTAGICTVTVKWNDELAGGLGAQTFKTTSRL
jgi:type IV pilus assembly protein PilV